MPICCVNPSKRYCPVGLMVGLGTVAIGLLVKDQPESTAAAIALFGAMVAIWQYGGRKNKN